MKEPNALKNSFFSVSDRQMTVNKFSVFLVLLLALVLAPFSVTEAGLLKPDQLTGALPLSSSILRAQEVISTQKMFANFAPRGTRTGIIVASPTRHHPDYFHHWIRDAALSYQEAHELYLKSNKSSLRNLIRQFTIDYIRLNQEIQNDETAQEGLGEPRFLVNGRASQDPWGRPQNDGPALRAINFVTIYQTLVRENWPEKDQLTLQIYDSVFPSQSILKRDLEYLAYHWRDSSFDLWEETRGQHFFTLMTQRKALLLGSDLASALQDPGAAFFYRTEAFKISSEIEKFWSTSRGYVLASTYGGNAGQSRQSRLDIAVILGALAGDLNDGFFTPTDDRILATMRKLQNAFGGLFPINFNRHDTLGEALGRYPEDTYDGYTTHSIGNPWFLANHAGAEIYYRICAQLKNSGHLRINDINIGFFNDLLPGKIWVYEGQDLSGHDSLFHRIVSELRLQGDRMLARSLFHGADDGSLSEQINRDHGYMQGAEDLTWSHSSFLTAINWRKQSL